MKTIIRKTCCKAILRNLVLFLAIVFFAAVNGSQLYGQETLAETDSIALPEGFGVEPSEGYPKEISSGVIVVDAVLGVLKKIDGETILEETDEIELFPKEDEYGWMLKIRTNKENITWKEELELPRMPLSWGETEGEISEDKRISTIATTENPQEGIISNFWKVAFGDPEGPYKLRVYVEGVLVTEFTFFCRYR